MQLLPMYEGVIISDDPKKEIYEFIGLPEAHCHKTNVI